ncbi:MAG: hypothetical protein H6738_11260 [Alphaproteobacteria bacterium]|nr:hypothetical protein [Alphaproteobacteria bacterium]MCB9697348.1 hypothetical protein [Alphaproteobacteria bacterium]
MTLVSSLLLWTACAPVDDHDPCRQGWSRARDGHCYPPATEADTPDATDAIEATPPCILDKPDGRLDLETGCADGICVGDTYERMAALLGEGECVADASFPTALYCTFDPGLQGLFADEDEDGIPDEEAETPWLRLLSRWPYATADGLGMGTSARCWTEILGTPSSAWFTDRAGSLALDGMVWDRYGLEVHDWQDDDGLIDTAYLF